MAKQQREALSAARKLREKFRDRSEFNQAEYLADLKEELKPFEGVIYAEAVEAIAEKVDRESADDLQRRLSGQLELFDLEGEYRLGQQRRVAKRCATIEQAREALHLAAENVEAVQQAYQRRCDELSRLEPYWGPGVPKEQAVNAYRQANPPAETA